MLRVRTQAVGLGQPYPRPPLVSEVVEVPFAQQASINWPKIGMIGAGLGAAAILIAKLTRKPSSKDKDSTVIGPTVVIPDGGGRRRRKGDEEDDE